MRILILLSFIVILSACQPENRHFVDHQKLSPDVEWLKADAKTFEVDIEDINQAFDFKIAFRYAQGFQYEYARVNLKEIAPNGVENTSEHSLKIRNKDGSYIGDAGFDIWDSEHLIESSKTYNEAGTYTYVLEHNMPQDPFYYAMEIGLILDKVE